jgi:hypothetical protein
MFLSFATDSEFRGACVVKGANVRGAVMNARKLGIWPGGEVIGQVIPAEHLKEFPPDARERLLTEREARTKLGCKGLTE